MKRRMLVGAVACLLVICSSAPFAAFQNWTDNGRYVQFKIDEEFIEFEAIKNHPNYKHMNLQGLRGSSVKVDFGDGKGWGYASMGDWIPVKYSDTGLRPILFEVDVEYEDGQGDPAWTSVFWQRLYDVRSLGFENPYKTDFFDPTEPWVYQGKSVKFYISSHILEGGSGVGPAYYSDLVGRYAARIDFDDGKGEQQVNFGDVVTVDYENVGTGIKTIRVRYWQQFGDSFDLDGPDHKLDVRAIAVPMPQKTEYITADRAYNTEKSYSGQVYYFEPKDLPVNEPRKFVIVVDGIDYLNRKKNEQLYVEFFQHPDMALIERIRNRGYTVVMLNPEQGAGYIQGNAHLMVKLLQNLMKNYHAEQFVVVGPSMGGLIARYALAWMEKEGLNHNTRLFVSWDAPQKGANIPLGIQVAFDRVKDELSIPAIHYNIDRINSPAARQMLYYHGSNSGAAKPAPEFSTFYKELSALGYPQKLRKVAVANGSGHGSEPVARSIQYYDFSTGVMSYHSAPQPGETIGAVNYHDGSNCFEFVREKEELLTDLRIRVSAIGPGAEIFYARAEACGKEIEFGGGTIYASMDVPHNFDSVPGGTFDAPAAAVSMAGGLITSNTPSVTFIPTVSALDIGTNDYYYNISSDAHILDKTPFDAIKYGERNEDHLFFTEINLEFILNELDHHYLGKQTRSAVLVPILSLLQ